MGDERSRNEREEHMPGRLKKKSKKQAKGSEKQTQGREWVRQGEREEREKQGKNGELEH